MTTDVEALVVGGGIGGLATSLALARSGRTVHCLERGEDFAEIGAGLQFGPNASRALDRLGVLDDVLPYAVRPDNAVLMDAMTAEVLTVLDLGDGFRQRYGYPYLVLHRHDLLEVLLKHCREHELVTLETRKKAIAAELGDTFATVKCEDGSRFRARWVIGADGLNSVLRPHVSDDAAQCSGYAAYRGTMPMAGVAHAVAPDDVVLWIGPGIHLMQYPVRRSELYNQVAVFKSPRFAAGHTGQGEWGGADELDSAFAEACLPVRQAVSHIGRERYWAMFDRDPITSWSTRNLLLMGDAAHPMLQYLGQGACQALEDAVEIGRQFGAHMSDQGVDFAAVKVGYEETRIPRASRCQTSARPWGELWHSDDQLLVATRNAMFAKRAADDYSDLDWLYADEKR